MLLDEPGSAPGGGVPSAASSAGGAAVVGAAAVSAGAPPFFLAFSFSWKDENQIHDFVQDCYFQCLSNEQFFKLMSVVDISSIPFENSWDQCQSHM